MLGDSRTQVATQKANMFHTVPAFLAEPDPSPNGQALRDPLAAEESYLAVHRSRPVQNVGLANANP